MKKLVGNMGIPFEYEFLRTAFVNVAEGVIALNPDQIIEMLNPAVERIFGYEDGQLTGKNIGVLVPEFYQAFLESQSAIDGEEIHWTNQETGGRRKDGSIFALGLAVGRMRTDGDFRYILILRDLTENRETRAALRKCEKRFRNLADNVPVLIRMSGADAGCEYFNKGWLEFTGRTLEQEQGNGWLEAVHPEDLSNCLGIFGKSFIQRTPFETEYRLRRFDDKYRWVLDKGAPRFNESGSFVGFISSCSDIDERRTIESNLREVSILQRAILDSADHMIISTTPDGIITTFNSAAERRLGYSAGEVVGKQTPLIFHDTDEVQRHARKLSGILGKPISPGFEAFVAKARAGVTDESEWTYTRKDGSRLTVLLSVTALRDAENRIEGFLGVAGDITDRKKADDAIARLAAIIEFSDDAIISQSPDGTIVSWNEGAERIYGYSAGEILGKPYSLLAPSNRQEEVHAIFDRLNRGEQVDHFETVRRRKDGALIEVSLSKSPIRNGGGAITGISTIARDITGRKKNEEQLRKLSLAVEQSPVSVVITDTAGIIEYVNPKFTEVTGYKLEEVLGGNPRILKSGEKSPEEYKELWDTISLGGEWKGVFHNKKKNGELYWESASISPIKDATGSITHYIAIKEDISAIKKAEEELAKLSLVASKTDNAVIITDSDGYIEWVNEGFVRLTGYTFAEAIGKKPGHLLQGAQSSPETVRKISAMLKSALPFTEEILNYHKDGRVYWVSLNVTPIFDDKGKLVRFISIESDITQRKQAEEALQAAKEAADAASQAKSEFLAGMSHEIRTPMNAIIGMAELLAETPLNPEQKKYVEIFRSAGETLLTIINDILDISKVEAGHIQLECTGFNLVELTETLCEVMAVAAHRKGIELACHIMPDVPENLVGDPGRLRQILLNLVGNAIKFTDHGQVMVEIKLRRGEEAVSSTQSEGDSCALDFSVTDTGIGIPSDKIELVFEKFSQADKSITRKYGGTGLGLSISRQLVELMGGRIQVESKVGEGSSFSFTAAFGIQEKPFEAPLERDLSGIMVLIVDDNAANRMILKETMTRWGACVVEVEGGGEAIAELKRARDAGSPYSFVLLDHRMPGMEGFEVAEFIKRDSGLAHTAVMMLSSDDRSEDIARAREMGIGSYLVKPVKRTDLLNALMSATGIVEASRSPGTQTAQSAVSMKPLRILLVDDSPENRLLVQAYLKDTPYEVEMAENGQVAVHRFISDNYDLVLMDMEMPVMDGISATKAIRKWERQNDAKPVPILALTAYALKEETQRMLDAGCSAHLTKPIKRAELLEAICAYSSCPEGKDIPETSDKLVVHVDADLEDIIPEFLENRRADIVALTEALAGKDFEAIRILGHTLKGVGGGYGFHFVTNLGASLEQAAREKNAEEIGMLVKELADGIRSVEVVYE